MFAIKKFQNMGSLGDNFVFCLIFDQKLKKRKETKKKKKKERKKEKRKTWAFG